MSLAANCVSSCPTPINVQVPGTDGDPGDPGASGVDGVNAYATYTAATSLTIPAIGSPVTIPASLTFDDISWVGVGQTVFLTDGTKRGTFTVDSKTGSTVLGLTFLGAAGDSAVGDVIATGANLSPAGAPSALSAALPAALTDNSTGTASDTIAAGVGIQTLAFAIQLASMTTAAADLATTYTPGYAFKILSLAFVNTTLGTGAAASQIINLAITGVATTGGVLTLTLANTTPLGNLVSATAITAANTGTVASTISIKVAAGGTVFTAGAGNLFIRLQNMDSANSIASLADKVNDLITSLS